MQFLTGKLQYLCVKCKHKLTRFSKLACKLKLIFTFATSFLDGFLDFGETSSSDELFDSCPEDGVSDLERLLLDELESLLLLLLLLLLLSLLLKNKCKTLGLYYISFFKLYICSIDSFSWKQICEPFLQRVTHQCVVKLQRFELVVLLSLSM